MVIGKFLEQKFKETRSSTYTLHAAFRPLHPKKDKEKTERKKKKKTSCLASAVCGTLDVSFFQMQNKNDNIVLAKSESSGVTWL
jgi:hypothetical protein